MVFEIGFLVMLFISGMGYAQAYTYQKELEKFRKRLGEDTCNDILRGKI